MQLRDYQQRCHDSILEQWRRCQSTLAVLATGLGKTVIFAHIIKSLQPKRALVLAHRSELIWQAVDKIRKATGLECEVEMADYSARTNLFHRTPVVVATVQTMNSRARMTRFRPQDFGVLIVDEVHHATSASYRKIIDYFSTNPELKILGVTATPDRADEESLGQIFKSTAFEYDILNGVQNGWLVDVTQQFFAVKSLDFSHVRTTAGDLNGKDLNAIMEQEENIQGIIQPSLEVIHGLPPRSLSEHPVEEWGQILGNRGSRRTIVFTASVLQAEASCNILNRAKPGIAEWVCGTTPRDKREMILARFASGETPVVCNCGVLTEGFDNPAVEIIVMARPTKSRALYAQMVGRSTRPLPGIVDNLPTVKERLQGISASQKPYCRIIDFVGNSGRHKLITAYDILGGKVSEALRERAIAKCKENGQAKFVCKHLTNEQVAEEKERIERANRLRAMAEDRKRRLIAKVNFHHHNVDPFGKERGPVQDRFNSWRAKRPPSEKMIKLLRRKGHANPEQYDFRQAMAIIDKIAEKEGWKKERTTNGQ